MNWKEFLKPNWKKIIIFVIIFIITHTEEIPSVWKYVYQQVLINYGAISFTFILIIDALIIYFLSCLIVWIYDKVKKK